MEHNSTACRQREVGGERWGEFEEAEADKKGAVYLTCFTPLQLSLAHSTPVSPLWVQVLVIALPGNTRVTLVFN